MSTTSTSSPVRRIIQTASPNATVYGIGDGWRIYAQTGDGWQPIGTIMDPVRIGARMTIISDHVVSFSSVVVSDDPVSSSAA